VTDTVKSIISCLGKARVVCFGDGMGTVFSRNRIVISRLTGIKRIKKWLAFFFIEKDFLRNVEIFYLMLPVIESKVKGVTAKVQIPDKISIGRTIDALCLESKEDMSEFIRTQMDENTAVICLENLSESRFIEFDTEIQLYIHFINTLNSKSTRVYLKPHPLQEMPKAALIAAAINDRDVLLLPESLSRTPVEYWPLKDFKGTICSMGVPNISLKYLYDLSVSNPASDEVIREFMENSYQESFFWVEEQLRRIELKLENWDGASILFVQR
jgi:hypothetical protein